MSHLGKFFRNRRNERKLSLGQVARLLGYQNASKGANKIQSFEGGGKIALDLLDKLADVLEIGPDEIRQRSYEDYKDWLAWASEPVRPYVVVRHLAAISQRVELPDDAIESEAAESFAANIARERKFKVCLVLSRRVSIWFDAEGKEYRRTEATPEMPCEPFMMIVGKRVQLDSGGSGMKPIDGPLA